MQAIEVKYLGATNHRGSRLKATCQSGSVTISWDYSISHDELYKSAAIALIEKLGWYTRKDLINSKKDKLIPGQLHNGNWVFVFNPLVEAI